MNVQNGHLKLMSNVAHFTQPCGVKRVTLAHFIISWKKNISKRNVELVQHFGSNKIIKKVQKTNVS
jgi:hypothetical protein